MCIFDSKGQIAYQFWLIVQESKTHKIGVCCTTQVRFQNRLCAMLPISFLATPRSRNERKQSFFILLGANSIVSSQNVTD